MEEACVKLYLYLVLNMVYRETEQIPFKSNRGNKLQLFPTLG